MTIPGPLPTLNDRLRRWTMTSTRKKWERIFAAHKNASRIPDAHSRRNIVVTRYYGRNPLTGGAHREWDYDNLVGGCKPVVDAMVRTRLLVGDGPKDCAISYRQVAVKGTTHTVFEISDPPLISTVKCKECGQVLR